MVAGCRHEHFISRPNWIPWEITVLALCYSYWLRSGSFSDIIFSLRMLWIKMPHDVLLTCACREQKCLNCIGKGYVWWCFHWFLLCNVLVWPLWPCLGIFVTCFQYDTCKLVELHTLKTANQTTHLFHYNWWHTFCLALEVRTSCDQHFDNAVDCISQWQSIYSWRNSLSYSFMVSHLLDCLRSIFKVRIVIHGIMLKSEVLSVWSGRSALMSWEILMYVLRHVSKWIPLQVRLDWTDGIIMLSWFTD